MSGIMSMLLGAVSSAAAAADEFFNRVTLLLNTSSTNGAQNNTFLDSSSNAFSITRNGNTTQGTFTPFSQTGWGNYFDGTGDYLTAPSSTAFGPGTGDFTIEFWLYATVFTDSFGVCQFGTAGTNWEISSFTNNLSFWKSGSGSSSFGANPTVNAWDHFAMSRSGTTLYFYKNGVRTNSATSFTSDIGTTNAFSIGLTTAFTKTTTGYISNFRYIKGTALYTGTTLTVPTSPLTAITNTQLLTCQSNRFLDNSTNVFALTPNGNVAVQAFSPFAPTAAYDSAVVGGSGYFDGTGDSLSAPSSSAAFNFSGDYTVEFWMYTASRVSDSYLVRIFDSGNPTNGFSPFAFYFGAGPSLNFYSSSNGTSWNIINNQSIISTIAVNQWYHIALTRSGSGTNNTKIFVNGVQAYQYTDTTAFTRQNGFGVNSSAQTGTSGGFQGYIAGLRVLNGTGYTSISVPTSPPTAITNTQLLLSATNAGIYDAAAKNDLETVGNAQVSTTQAKFGTTSMAFDGTGDWLLMPDSPNLQLGTGDFTIDGFVYLNAAGVAYGIISKGAASTGWSVNVTSGNKLQFSYTATALTGATSLAASTWYYFAVVRSGSATGNLKVYLDGSVDATSGGAVTDNFNQTNVMYIGASRTGTTALNGYLDEVRVTKYARTITTPTAAFPLQ
jgi:hypothetical protein